MVQHIMVLLHGSSGSEALLGATYCHPGSEYFLFPFRSCKLEMSSKAGRGGKTISGGEGRSGLEQADVTNGGLFCHFHPQMMRLNSTSAARSIRHSSNTNSKSNTEGLSEQLLHKYMWQIYNDIYIPNLQNTQCCYIHHAPLFQQFSNKYNMQNLYTRFQACHASKYTYFVCRNMCLSV